MSNNFDRAQRITHVFKSDKYYRHAAAVAMMQALSELLTDCMHYATLKGINFEDTLLGAKVRYEIEKRGTNDMQPDILELEEE